MKSKEPPFKLFDTPKTLHKALAQIVARNLADAVAEKGFATLMLSGGSTPRPFLHSLGEEPVEWSKVRIGLVDERWVPADDEASNERMVRETLLEGPAREAAFFGMYRGDSDAETACDPVGKTIAEALMPFDVVVLGMGTDGHTASLFPNHPALATGLDPDSEAVCVALQPETAPHMRLSLTLAAILSAKHCYLHIEGAHKLTVYNEALDGSDAEAIPIRAFLHREHFPLEVYYS